MHEQEQLSVRGSVRHFETDLDNNIIPGTLFEGPNTIQSSLKKYLAWCIAVDKNLAIDNFFTGSVPATEISAGRLDGIAFTTSEGPSDIGTCFITTLNVGGDGVERYVEFYGYVEGAVTLNGYLQLGYNLYVDGGGNNTFKGIETGTDGNSHYASYAINKSVAANRRYHFYWKITIG